MAGLARRLRARFPALLNQTYFPKRYPIISTQVRLVRGGGGLWTGAR